MAAAFVGELIAGDRVDAESLIVPGLDRNDLNAWMNSIAGDPRAWVIASRNIAAAAGIARVIVSVASPNSEPIGFVIALTNDSGAWLVSDVGYA